MKIKTITCHDVYNCGASLQAYALQEYLISQGHDVEIINYKPDYFDFKYKWSWYVSPHSPYYAKCKGNAFYRIIYVTQRFLRSYTVLGRKKIFDTFTKKYLKLTRKYDDYYELVKDAPSADMYIVGSDQVWNNGTLNNGCDPAFFLAFGDKKVRRISYAASFGVPSSRIYDIIHKYIENLDAVSVREESGRNMIKEIAPSAVVVCDPVFLLSKEQWSELCTSRKSDERYLLIYNLGKVNKDLVAHACQLAKKRKLRIYSIKTSDTKIRADKELKEVGPLEFVNVIANASVILSNSFHATAFSVIFEKEFYTYTFHNREASQRMTDFLNRIGMIHFFNPKVVGQEPVKKMHKDDKYYELINHSKNWLLTQIETSR